MKEDNQEINTSEKSKPRVKLLTIWKLERQWEGDSFVQTRNFIHGGFWETYGVEERDNKRFYTMVCRMPYMAGVNIGEEKIMEEGEILFFCTQVRIQELPKNFSIGEIKIRVSEIIENAERQKAINENDIANVEFLDDDGKVIKIDQKIIDDFQFTGLNLSDFIVSGFYLTGFDKELTSK